jgi:hypothetical protein
MIKLFLAIFAILMLCVHCESKKDPLEEGAHFGYNIQCINGFKYKCTKHTETLILEKDGKPMKCK